MSLPVVSRRDPNDPTSPWLCSTAGCDADATSQWPVSCEGSDCPTVGAAEVHAHPLFGCDAHPRPVD